MANQNLNSRLLLNLNQLIHALSVKLNLTSSAQDVVVPLSLLNSDTTHETDPSMFQSGKMSLFFYSLPRTWMKQGFGMFKVVCLSNVAVCFT